VSVLERSDEALYRRLLAGELGAFDALHARHARPLLGFIRAQLDGEVAEAEDVLHEVFLAVLKEKEAGRAALSLKAWLFQVARHLCLNRRRSARRRDAAVQAVATPPPGPLPADQALDGRQRAHRVEAAVGRLPEHLGALYRLRASGLSYQELATVLGIPEGTVKSRLHELVRQLQEDVT
jgi:RNA polymerase sigma-70 factor, ECF subfamily